MSGGGGGARRRGCMRSIMTGVVSWEVFAMMGRGELC